jgi:hypothetical protein
MFGMVEGGGGAGFLRETLQAVGVGGEGRGKNLDGDVAVKTRVASAVHLAHTAGSKGRLNFVWTQSRARSEGHFLSARL